MAKPRIVQIAFSFQRGGAALAAQRFAEALKDGFVLEQYSTEGFPRSIYGSMHCCSRIFGLLLSWLMADRNSVKHSLNIFSDRRILRVLREKRNRNAVFNLHWINNETIGVFQFSRLPPKTIVTLHDEWFVNGAEHCSLVNSQGFHSKKKYSLFDPNVLGINWNWIIWKLKQRAFSRRPDIIFTVPSHWLAERVRESSILGKNKVIVIPNPVNGDDFFFEQESRIRQRLALGLSDRDFVFVFSFAGGAANVLKGVPLLVKASQSDSFLTVRSEQKRIVFCYFGSEENLKGVSDEILTFNLGKISDSENMRLVYCLSDVVVVPSLLESFGQVAAEASACERPVVAFDTSGLKDIIVPGMTGLLASPFDPESLGESMAKMVLMDEKDRKRMGCTGRKRIVDEFSPKCVQERFEALIDDCFHC